MPPLDPLLAGLFSPNPRARDSEARVVRRLQEFRDSTRVTEKLDREALSSRFTTTTVPEEGGDVDAYFDSLFERTIPHAIRTHSPHFAGHMTSALPSFVETLGRIIIALNQNVVKLETSGSLTFVERQTLAMLHRLLFDRTEAFYAEHCQKAGSTLGMVTSGGTVGNIAALWCARNERLGRKEGFAGIEAEGVVAALEAHGFRRAIIIGSSLMHYSLDKAADILGLGSSALVRIPARADGTIDMEMLHRRIDDSWKRKECVLALIGIAGTTETGSVDPLHELADTSEACGAHFHVDAAWGGPVLFSRKYRPVLSGMERADSVTMDGHKQLYLPMGIGTVLFRDPQLAAVIERSAQYALRAGSVDLGSRAFEGSRPAKALQLHAAINIFGRSGYEQLIDIGVNKARQLAVWLKERMEFELLGEPHLNIIVYRFIPHRYRHAVRTGAELDESAIMEINQVNQLIQVRQFGEGSTFASRTSLSHTKYGPGIPIVCLRLVLANPLTWREHLEAILADQLRLGDTLERELGIPH